MLHVDDESIHSTFLVYWAHHQRGVHLRDWSWRHRVLGSTTTEKVAKVGENSTSRTGFGEEH